MRPIFIFWLMISCWIHATETNNTIESMASTSNTAVVYDFKHLSHAYENYHEGVEVAKKTGKNLFVLFISDHCRWCKKLQATTLLDPQLLQRLNEEFVVVVLERDRSEYPSIFKIRGVPTVYMMSNQEKIYVERMGYFKDPKDYTKWFNYVKIESEL